MRRAATLHALLMDMLTTADSNLRIKRQGTRQQMKYLLSIPVKPKRVQNCYLLLFKK